MTSTADVHLGDIGTLLRVAVTENGEPADISAATMKKLLFYRKDRSTFERDAEFATSGSDGILLYTSGSADFTVKGELKVQVYLELPAGKWHTDIQSITVGDIISVV